MLTGQQVQRLGSHIARSRPVIATACDAFAYRLAARAPAARGVFAFADRNARFRAGEAIALVAHHLADLPLLSPWLRGAGRSLARAGFQVGDFPAAAAAMLSAVRSASGGDWNSDLESDFRQLIEFLTAEMARGAAGVQTGGRTALAA